MSMELLISIFETVKFILVWFWWAILLVCIGICKLLWKGWILDVVIIEKRGSNLIRTNDRAGKYKDPYTGMIGYRLKKAKDTIPVVNFDWVLHNVAVHTNILERFVNLIRGNVGTIFLFRYGSKQYKPINIKQKVGDNGEEIDATELQEIKDKDGNSIFIKVYNQFDPRYHFGALDFEVVDWDNMNFMVQEQRASIERRQKKGEWLKQLIVPLGIMAVTAVVCIIMIKFSFDYSLAIRSSNAPQQNQPATQPNIPIISDVLPGT